MAKKTLTYRLQVETELETARNICVLTQWIERARELADNFSFMHTHDEVFKKRCKDNDWFPVPWTEAESEALVHLSGLQEGAIRNVIKASSATENANV